MKSATGRHFCVKNCEKFGFAICAGCQQLLCKVHFFEHRETLNNGIDRLTEERNEVYQQVIKDEIPLASLLHQIDTWEKKAIEKIQQRAKELRNDIKNHFDQTKNRLKSSLKLLSDELIHSHNDEEFSEIDLNQWQRRLKRLKDDLDQLSNVTIKYQNVNMTDEIRLLRPKFIQTQKFYPTINDNAQWSPTGVVVAGGNSVTDTFYQLNRPVALDMDNDGTLFIADTDNHRIVAWRIDAKQGEVIAGGKGKGNQADQLDTPVAILIDRINSCLIISEMGNRRISRWSLQQREPFGEVILSNIVSWGLAMDDEGSLYVSDTERHEVRCYPQKDSIGVAQVVAGGNGQGAGLYQLNDPRHIFVAQDRSIYISDANNHRVVKWMKNNVNGVIILGGCGEGKSVQHLNQPRGLFVDSMGSVYVVDQLNRRVLRSKRNGTQISAIVDGNVRQLSSVECKMPASLAFDNKGNLHIVDCQANYVIRFPIE